MGKWKRKCLVLHWEENREERLECKKRKRGERKREVGHSKWSKKKEGRSERKERGVLERKGLRREGSRLGELDFLKRSRLILHSKKLNINPSSLRAKLGA